MKTLTIYFHPTERKGRDPILSENIELVGYIRTVVGDYDDTEQALSNASPLHGEVVLNTVKCEL
jgi:hypothetical protein